MDNNKLARINYRIQDIMARKDMMGIFFFRERKFIQGDIVLLQAHSDNTATIEQKFTR